MSKQVLIVDDNQEMLRSLEEGLQQYYQAFSVITAGDGLIAMDELRRRTISLVVTDLKMPEVDGLTLLAHIMEHYPEIPVIIITAYSTPELERLARQGGAVGYIAKPFMIEDLARRILRSLRKETEGGKLHSVSSGMFLQLIEMEQKTCTIRLEDRDSHKQGVLFFQEGQMLDARANGLRGEAAACEIFSWDEVSLSIQNTCAHKEKRIHRELQAIIMEAMKLKDERKQAGEDAFAGETEEIASAASGIQDMSAVIDNIRSLLEREMGNRCGVEDIYRDKSWNNSIFQMKQIGSLLDMGSLKLGYVDQDEGNDFILLPDKETVVISVNPKCPRDRMMQLLGG
ncbi:MAG: response regulator [Desulfobacteraceae bacterium]|jgi:CheY-like chemotaxis protein